MEQKKALSPLLKLALEFGPLAVFFVVYNRADIFTATAVFIPTILIALGLSWKLGGKLPKMALVTAIVVVVFGGLTLILQDATFIYMKPTIVNMLFAFALAFGLMRGQSYLKTLMEEGLQMDDAGWMVLTKRFAILFFVMAVINELIWRTQTEAFWVNFKTFASPAITFIFMMAQMGLIKRHMLEDEKSEG